MNQFKVSEADCDITSEIFPFDQNSSGTILVFEFSCDSPASQRATLLNAILDKYQDSIDFSKIRVVKWKNFSQKLTRAKVRRVFLYSNEWCAYTRGKKVFPYNIALISDILAKENLFSEIRDAFETRGLNVVADSVTNPLVRFQDDYNVNFLSNKICAHPSYPTFVDIFYKVEE